MKKRQITDFFQPGEASEKRLRLLLDEEVLDNLCEETEDLDGGADNEDVGINDEDGETYVEDQDGLDDLGGTGG